MNVQETWKNLLSIENPTRTLCPLLRDLENLDQRLVTTIILWVCKKIPGKPAVCVKCGGKAERLHLFECSSAGKELRERIPRYLHEIRGCWPEIYISTFANVWKYPDKCEVAAQVANAIRRAAADCLGHLTTEMI